MMEMIYHLYHLDEIISNIPELFTNSVLFFSQGPYCTGGQECVSYKECLNGKKLFGRILAKSDADPEKTELMEQFKSLRCGNFNRDKTVCCDGEKKIDIPVLIRNQGTHLKKILPNLS